MRLIHQQKKKWKRSTHKHTHTVPLAVMEVQLILFHIFEIVSKFQFLTWQFRSRRQHISCDKIFFFSEFQFGNGLMLHEPWENILVFGPNWIREWRSCSDNVNVMYNGSEMAFFMEYMRVFIFNFVVVFLLILLYSSSNSVTSVWIWSVVTFDIIYVSF